MDYQKFINQLPNLYENWGEQSVRPKSNKFKQVLEEVKGFTTASVMQLLNFAVGCMDPREVYCQIGCSQGAALIGALLDQSERMAYLVDYLSEFEQLVENLDKFNLKSQVLFSDQDFEEFFLNLRNSEIEHKIGVYFCNAFNDYRSQLLSLLLAKPFLVDKALIIINDSNWSTVQQASYDFILNHPKCHSVLDLPTPNNGHRSFWNGINILLWNGESEINCDWNILKKKPKNLVTQASHFCLQFRPPAPVCLPAKYIQINDFLPAEDSKIVFEIYQRHKNNFVPSMLGPEKKVDLDIRQSNTLDSSNFHEFSKLMKDRVLKVLPNVLKKLNHQPFLVSNIDVQMTTHNDGCYYKMHADATISDFNNTVNREISYVYYFYQEPKAFIGGELRIYDTELTSDSSVIRGGFTAIEPRNNSIVFFNSRCLHEVMPVNCPSRKFEDGRFTINGWIYA